TDIHTLSLHDALPISDTGGPLRSVQLMVKELPSVPQRTSTQPVSVESAPYLPALVASSWSASPMACAEAGLRRSLGPCTAMRERSEEHTSELQSRSDL